MCIRDRDTSLRDFYWRYDRGLARVDETPFQNTVPSSGDDTLTTAQKLEMGGQARMYELTFSNKGGLVMPIIIEWTFKDGSKEVDMSLIHI